MTDDKPTLSQCCGEPIRYDLAPQCEACGQRQPSDDLLDRVSQGDGETARVPGDVRDLESASTTPEPITQTTTGRTYRDATHALEAYLWACADGAPALDPSPAPSGSVSSDAAYVKDVHEARELARIFQIAYDKITEHLHHGKEDWETWCRVRLDGVSLRSASDDAQSTVNDQLSRVDGWIEWVLDGWGKYEGNADRPVGIGGDVRKPQPKTQAVRSEGVAHPKGDDHSEARPDGLR